MFQNLNLKSGENLIQLFGDTAENTARVLNNGNKPEITTTQFRQFYEKVSNLVNESETVEQKSFRSVVLPQFVLLKSKANYSKERRLASENVVKLFGNKVNSPEELKNFKLFLEAIIGYMPKK
jgi:CRISPR type III-A-associated protein Csm2